MHESFLRLQTVFTLLVLCDVTETNDEVVSGRLLWRRAQKCWPLKLWWQSGKLASCGFTPFLLDVRFYQNYRFTEFLVSMVVF